MAEPIMFHISGTPRPQPRPRFVKGRAISTASNPAKLWRLMVERAARDAIQAMELEPFGGAVRVDMVFSFQPPANKRERIGQPHTQKPDRDNLEKLCLDVLTKVGMFRDDAQVSRGETSKIWDHAPGCTVLVTPLATAASPGGGQDGQTGGVGYVGSGGWLKAAGGLPEG